jgi:hypothetical protein
MNTFIDGGTKEKCHDVIYYSVCVLVSPDATHEHIS